MYMYTICFCTLYTLYATGQWDGQEWGYLAQVSYPDHFQLQLSVRPEWHVYYILEPFQIVSQLWSKKAVRQNLEWKAWVQGYVYYVLVEHFWRLYILSFHSPVLQRVLVTPTSSPYPTWKICLQFSRKPDCRLLHHLHCPHLFHDCLNVWFNVTAAVSSSIDLYPWIIFAKVH